MIGPTNQASLLARFIVIEASMYVSKRINAKAVDFLSRVSSGRMLKLFPETPSSKGEVIRGTVNWCMFHQFFHTAM